MFVNLTPYEVNLKSGSRYLTIPPCGDVAILSAKSICVGSVDSVKVFRSVAGEIEGLPPKRENIKLIVSRQVAENAIDRDDLFVVGDPLRDCEGRLFGCRGLYQLFAPSAWGRFKNRLKTIWWFLK